MSRNPHNPYYLELLDEEERSCTGADIRHNWLRGTTIGQIVNWSNNAFININRFRTEDIVWLAYYERLGFILKHSSKLAGNMVHRDYGQRSTCKI